MTSRGRPLAVLAAALAGFALLAADLLLHGPVSSHDEAISLWLHARMQPVVTEILWGFTHLHSTIGLVLMSAVLAVILVAKHRGRWVPWLVLTVQGGQLLNAGVKELFHRARPHWDTPLVQLATYSFPSGHAAGSTVFWGFVCVLAAAEAGPRDGSRRWVPWLFLLAALMVALTDLSRVYLGAHYLSDVLAGTCEGIAWVALCQAVRARTMRA